MNPALIQALIKGVELLAKVIITATADYMKFEHEVTKSFRTMGVTGEKLRATTKAITDDQRKWGIALGMTRDEFFELHKGLKRAHGTVIEFSDDTKRAAGALSKLIGTDVYTDNVKKMREFGMSARSANAWIGKGVIQAKALGLNADEFTKNMTQAVEITRRMNFQGGISGLQKMVGLATRLGTSVENLTKHIDVDSGKFSDIQGSIEAAANIQKLGGNFAMNFSNPMEVMAEGMFDAEASANRLIKTLDGLATFDKKTGQAKMSWFENKRIGAFAQAMGMDPNELRKMAQMQAMGKELEAQMRTSNARFSMFSEDELDAIKNLAEFDADTGQFQISYTDTSGDTHTTQIKDLTVEELKKITNLTKEEENINKNVHTIAGKVGLIADKMVGTTKESRSIQEMKDASEDNIANYFQSFFGFDGIARWFGETASSITDSVTKFFSFGHADGGVVQPSVTGIEGVSTLPKFESGGVSDKGLGKVQMVPGTSTQGDRVLTRVNSGEMILNKDQQTRLFNLLDGKVQKFADGGIVGDQYQTSPNMVNARSVSTLRMGGEIMKKTAQVVTSPKFERVMTNLVSDASKLVTRSARLIPTSTKDLSNMAKLTRSYLAARYMPTRALSNTNLWSRFTRSQLSQYNSTRGIARTWGNAATKADEVRNTIKGVFTRVKPPTVTPITDPSRLLPASKNLSKVVTEVTNESSKFVKGLKAGRELVTTELRTVGTDISKVGKAVYKPIKFLTKGTQNLVGKGFNIVGSVAKPIITKTAELGGQAVQAIGTKALKSTTSLISKASAVGSKASSSIVNTTGKLLGKNAAKFVKGAGPIGTAISVGLAAFDAGSAISEFGDIKKDIEKRDDLTKSQKKQMIREAEDNRNEKVGGAVGTAAGSVIGGALGSILGPIGTTLGAMAGGWIGEKVGGFIGKNVNKAKEFLFGKEAEMSEKDEAQQEYEETKFGQVEVTEENAATTTATAVVAIHDLLISIWHHMNGKASNGEERKKGLFSKVGDAASSVVKGAVGIVTAPIRAVGGILGGLFGGKKSDEVEKEVSEEEIDFRTEIAENVSEINANIKTLLENQNIAISETEGQENQNTSEGVMDSILNFAFGGLFYVASAATKKAKAKLEQANVDIEGGDGINKDVLPSDVTVEPIAQVSPTPLGEEQVTGQVAPIETKTQTSENSSYNGTQNINLNVGGVIKLDLGNGYSKDVNFKSLLDNPEIQRKIMELVFQDINLKAGNGNTNKNSVQYSRGLFNGQNRGV